MHQLKLSDFNRSFKQVQIILECSRRVRVLSVGVSAGTSADVAAEVSSDALAKIFLKYFLLLGQRGPNVNSKNP